jgi:hypothetical protein
MGRFFHGRKAGAARRELASLADRLGLGAVSSWTAGLLAAVDQHAAAVRDILHFSGGRAGPIELAAYAQGVQDVASERGWRPPDTATGVAGWDWVSLRLAGVCLLAMAEPVAMASVLGGDADPLPFIF